MTSPIVSGIVIAIFGFTIGGLVGLVSALGGIFDETLTHPRHRRNAGEGGKKRTLRDFLRVANERAEEGRQAAELMPRSAKLFMAAFLGLIVVLVVIVRYSPIAMNWWALGISLCIGYVGVWLLFNHARKGKVHTKGGSFFDVKPTKRSNGQ